MHDYCAFGEIWLPTGVQHLSCEQEMANADDQYSDMQMLWFFQLTPAANHACIRCHIVVRLDLPQIKAIQQGSQ